VRREHLQDGSCNLSNACYVGDDDDDDGDDDDDDDDDDDIDDDDDDDDIDDDDDGDDDDIDDEDNDNMHRALLWLSPIIIQHTPLSNSFVIPLNCVL
jgi:ABC-type Zn2+ transport system substrate-binding protein/surface adhesin